METKQQSIRIGKVLNFLETSGEYFTFSASYVEPGYADPENGIVFADWNPPKMEQAARILEKLGCETEWDDEWSTCDQCGRAVRTEPDSYSWKPSFIMTDGGIDCKACLLDDPESYVDDFLRNNDKMADTFDVDLASLGYERIEEGENGFHPGQNDTSQSILKKAKEILHGRDFVFQIETKEQFSLSFSLWAKLETQDETE